MRLRLLSDRRRPLGGAVLLAAAALLLVGGASGAGDPGDAAGWESLLGDRPGAQLGGRWIVVLGKPSLASRVADAGGVATEQQEREWTAAARKAQREVLARLAFRGAPIEPFPVGVWEERRQQAVMIRAALVAAALLLGLFLAWRWFG